MRPLRSRFALVSVLTLAGATACSGDPAAGDAPDAAGTTSALPPDPTQNDGETDVDCGGSLSAPCADGKSCQIAPDCASGVCTGGICQAPLPTDGARNGDETGIDCGGAKAPKCPPGQGCASDTDCAAVKCDLGTKTCAAPTHDDGIENGDETGIDCGGPTATKRCPSGGGCVADADCDNVLCDTATTTCRPPASDDKLKNGNESAVDCGSSGPGANTNAPACDAGQTCTAGADCKSGGCNHKGVCAFARSCTAEHGGTTCGAGDATAATKQHEDCCASELVPTFDLEGYKNTLAPFRLDKYQISAGRIRRFLEAVGGDVKKWVSDNRAKVLAPDQLPASLDKFLPAGFTQPDSADTCTSEGNSYPCNYGALSHVSGFRFNNQPGGDNGYACYVGPGSYATRTYFTTAAENTTVGINESVMLVSKARADEKSMTCVTYFILAAFCAWDGGRLETLEEYNAAYGGDGTTGRRYPWGSDTATRSMGFTDLYSSVVVPTGTAGDNYDVFGTMTAQKRATTLARVARANHHWNYFDSQILDYVAPLEGRQAAAITAESTIAVADDSSVAVAPPGRYPAGAGRYGHRDLLGNVMEITATAPSATVRRWTRNGSFETAHVVVADMTGRSYTSASQFEYLTKYGRAGGRCARPVVGYLATPLP